MSPSHGRPPAAWLCCTSLRLRCEHAGSESSARVHGDHSAQAAHTHAAGHGVEHGSTRKLPPAHCGSSVLGSSSWKPSPQLELQLVAVKQLSGGAAGAAAAGAGAGPGLE